MIWRREIILCLPGIGSRYFGRPSRSPVTTLTELFCSLSMSNIEAYKRPAADSKLEIWEFRLLTEFFPLLGCYVAWGGLKPTFRDYLSRDLPEKLTGPHLARKFPAFYGNQRFITAFTTACHLSLSWARLIQSIHCSGRTERSVWFRGFLEYFVTWLIFIVRSY